MKYSIHILLQFLLVHVILSLRLGYQRNIYSSSKNMNVYSSNANMNNNNNNNHNNNNIEIKIQAYDFKSLSKLASRVDKLLSQQVEFMSSFWSDELNCFQIVPNEASSRVSITSTCLGIKTIIDNPKYWSKNAKWEHNDDNNINSNIKRISLQKVVNALSNVQWSFDSFQTPLLIQTFCSLNSINTSDEKFVDAVEQLLEQRSRLSLHRSQVNSAYLRYQNAKALLAIVETNSVPEHIVGSHRIGFALERYAHHNFHHYHISLLFLDTKWLVLMNYVVNLHFTIVVIVVTLMSSFLRTVYLITGRHQIAYF